MVHLGDIKKIHDPPFVDCITFGSPCQDLSIAGKRAGLSGERSGLFMEAVRIIKEMRCHSGGAYPTFAIWENVPGAFSSNKGNDFHAVLEELARIKEPEVSIPRPENGKWAKAGFICGNGWSIAWRTLDAQFWGVPQRRRRIALVLDLTGQRAGEILFERTGVSGNHEPSIPPWKGISRNPARGTSGNDRVVEGAGDCLTLWDVQSRRIYEETGMGWGEDGDPAYTLQAGHEHAVCCLLNDQGGQSINVEDGVVSPTLRAESHAHEPIICAAFTAGQGAKANGIGWSEEQAPTLRTDGGLSAMPTVLCRAQSNTNAETYEDLAPTIITRHDGPPIVFENRGFSLNYINPVAIKILRWIVRRLTPTECERLQGFPDGWTDIGDWIDSKGKHHKAADSPRYKALGNSIALPQWWWLTCKMAQFLPEHATLGSLFDGIGGFPLVWETVHGKGTAVWASEIEEFPIAVTKARFPE